MMRLSRPLYLKPYLTKDYSEMRLPTWMERSYPRRLNPQYNAMHSKRGSNDAVLHSNLAPDTDATRNYFLREATPWTELNKLVGVHRGVSDYEDYQHRREGPRSHTKFEMENPFLYRGAQVPVGVSIAKGEEFWSQKLYPNAHAIKSIPNSLLSMAQVDTAQPWWNHLQHLINTHYKAVGEITPGRWREVRLVSQFFTNFDMAITSADYQNANLALTLESTRPKELEDVYGIFIEMECNRIHPHYCPRCSLPYDKTHFCGEGSPWTPFRKHQALWAPHKPWSREWYESCANRAEALFNKSTEHPLFGTAQHTQRQVEALMAVYRACGLRGRANTFLANVRASNEYSIGIIKETSKLMELYEETMDDTPHPVLLSNFHVQQGVQKYIPSASHAIVPQSAKQIRIELEVDKMRREQKEQGVVRVPPKGYQLNMSDVVEYKIDEATGKVVNWREVKKGLETSFTKNRLTHDAYINPQALDKKQMLRELEYWTRQVRDLPTEKRIAELKKENESERKTITKCFVFPDESSYRNFNIEDKVLEAIPINNVKVKHGDVFFGTRASFPDETNIKVKDTAFNVSKSFCEKFGFVYGSRFESEDQNNATVIGVDTSTYELCAVKDDGEIVSLGATLNEVEKFLQAQKWKPIVGVTEKIEMIESNRTEVEEFSGVVIGSRKGKLYAQFFPEKGVATLLETTGWKSFSVKENIAGSIGEVPSWLVPFRNNRAEEHLEAATRAPWNQQPYASLIPGKLTPKRMLFGYTQHNKNDDFVTQEYKDRLLSKQFHHKPGAFQVIPDVYEKAPQLGGKWESIYTHGLPGVDRKELTHGWSKVEDVPDTEVNAIEQAIRDISGTRPGNYYRRTSEIEDFKLKESWWNINPFWKHHNRMEMAKPYAERQLFNPTKMPFGGNLPPLGTSAGMGERFEYIVSRLSKGFGIGPTGHTPHATMAKYDTLQNQSERAERLNSSHVLVKLFKEKLFDEKLSEAQFVRSFGAQPKELMISLHEWLHRGAQPTAILRSALEVFLKDDIAKYNENTPKELRLTCGSGSAVATAPTRANVWLERDPSAVVDSLESELTNEVEGDAQLIGEEGFIRYKYVQQHLHTTTLSSTIEMEDMNLERWCRQTYLDDFGMKLAKYVNVDISAGFLAAVQGSKEMYLREFRNANRWITQANFKKLLEDLRIQADDVRFIYAQAPDMLSTIMANQSSLMKSVNDKHSLANFGRDPVLYHVASLLKWSGAKTKHGTTQLQNWKNAKKEQQQPASPSAPSTNTTANKAIGGNKQVLSFLQSALQGTPAKSRQGAHHPMSYIMYTLVAFQGDGIAMDVKYASRENKRNSNLQAEFANFIGPMVRAKGGDDDSIRTVFQDYCEGTWVPSVPEAVSILKSYFVAATTDGSWCKNHVTLDRDGNITGLKPTPREVKPFEFENVLFEKEQTSTILQAHNVPDPRESDAIVAVAIRGKECATYTNFSSNQERGYFGYGDNAPQSGEDTEISLNTVLQGVKGELASSKITTATKGMAKVLASDDALKGFIKQVLLRYASLLPYYFKLRAEFNSKFEEMSSKQEALAKNFSHVFGLVSPQERKTSWHDDLYGFSVNPERYWKEMIRNGKSMANAHIDESKRNTMMSSPKTQSQQQGGKGGDADLGGIFSGKSPLQTTNLSAKPQQQNIRTGASMVPTAPPKPTTTTSSPTATQQQPQPATPTTATTTSAPISPAATKPAAKPSPPTPRPMTGGVTGMGKSGPGGATGLGNPGGRGGGRGRGSTP
eukprot:PhF_6_TR7926/c0_g1_i2/m.11863